MRKFPAQNDIEVLKNTVINASLAVNRLTGFMEEQRNRLDAILSSTEDGILLFDREMNLILQNEPGRYYLNKICNCSEQAGKCPVHQILLKTHSQSLASFKDSFYHQGQQYAINCQNLARPAQPHTYTLRISKIHSETESNSNYTSAFVQDIAVALAHEINNPLTPILALTSPGMQAGINPIEIFQHFDTIYESGEKIAFIIRELMNINALYLNSSISDFSALDLLRDLPDLETRLSPNSKQIKINAKPGKINIELKADRSQLKHIIYLFLKSLSTTSSNKKQLFSLSIRKTTEHSEIVISEDLNNTGKLKGYKNFYYLLAETLCLSQKIPFTTISSKDNQIGYIIQLDSLAMPTPPCAAKHL